MLPAQTEHAGVTKGLHAREWLKCKLLLFAEHQPNGHVSDDVDPLDTEKHIDLQCRADLHGIYVAENAHKVKCSHTQFDVDPACTPTGHSRLQWVLQGHEGGYEKVQPENEENEGGFWGLST